MINSDTKQQLLSACIATVQARIDRARATMESAQASANNETKSSMGDKYETGRAMMQLEKDKAAQQMAEAEKLMRVLEKIDRGRVCEEVELGSVVVTSMNRLFLAVAVGKLALEGQDYYALSPASPLGKLLLGKKVGDVVMLNGRKVEVLEVV